jgi:hypothetical protein
VLWVLAWPIMVWPAVWKYWRYQRVADRAEGWRYRLADDGIEVWRSDGAPRLIDWEKLRQGRWIARTKVSMASGDEELWVVEFPGTGVAFTNASLWLLYQAISARFGKPILLDGGRDSAGVPLTMVWVVMIAIALWASGVRCSL